MSMVAAQKHIEGRSKPPARTRSKHASGELDIHVERLLKSHPGWKAKQIAGEIGNTTADAVRQTEAWKSRPNKRKK
jgi:hypothetical protein